MGMYTQVVGVLNVGSITWRGRLDEVNNLIDEACEKASDYWEADEIRKRIMAMYGGNGSIFITIAVEGKIIGYGKDWDSVIRELCKLIPSLEGRLEWLYEEDKDKNIVFLIKEGKITVTHQPAYRNGYGNAC